MNLQHPKGLPSDHRPHQMGKAHGFDTNGQPVSPNIEWLIDSGAEVSVVWDQVGALFTTAPTGATASPTTGGQGILMVTGIDVEVEVEHHGWPSLRYASGDVGVKSSNVGSNIVGVATLEAVGAVLVWSSQHQTGTLVDHDEITPAGGFAWWADPNISHDAYDVLEELRAAGPHQDPGADPVARLRWIRARYHHEVQQLLAGFVGYREAEAIWLATIDSWNSHLTPVKDLSVDQRRFHAEELDAMTAELLPLCERIKDPELRPRVQEWIERHAADVRRFNG